jgi:hypothetical protein
MTRINLVKPSELHNKHLLAEYRELPRIFTLVKAAITRGENPDLTGIYVLGEGHVRFFYPRLGYLLNRYHLLVAECKARNWLLNPINDTALIGDIPPEWFNDYVPTEEALLLNRFRIKERMPKRSKVEIIDSLEKFTGNNI